MVSVGGSAGVLAKSVLSVGVELALSNSRKAYAVSSSAMRRGKFGTVNQERYKNLSDLGSNEHP